MLAPSDRKKGNLNISFYDGSAPFKGYTLQFSSGGDNLALTGEYILRIR